jgi:hypothetical protein
MTISGFTMVRNATKLYYPIKEAIASILPIVDEFVVALGDCDEDDHTLEEIQSLHSDKIKIIHTVWDLEKYPRGMEHAHQTDIAKEACTGDWLFYIQSDEVIHEKYLPLIKKKCEEFLNDKEVEGFLFHYRHFWGDYDHYISSHIFYNKEIRIIRNQKDIHSWESAQSFRRIPDFDGLNYRRDKKGTYKLKVTLIDAYVYHYGWVRPPRFMQRKTKVFNTIHFGSERAELIHRNDDELYHFGNLNEMEVMKDTHPAVMKDMISRFNWADQLYPNRPLNPKQKYRHRKFKYRMLSFIERKLLHGRQIFAFKNYIIVKK